MLYYIIGILFVLLIMSVVFLPKTRPAKRELKQLSSEDFIRGIRNLARENRIIDRGKGFSLQPMIRYLLRAERIVTFKVMSNKAVTEGEKWYYENLYFVKRFLDSLNIREFRLLPHSGDGIRILSIARYIVENSMADLSHDRIKKAIDTVNNEIVLTYKEMLSLRDAIGVAVVEMIYMLARRILHYNKMAKLAKKGFTNKGLKSDIYLHYLLAGKDRIDILNDLTRMGINVDGVEFNYAMSVVDTTRMAKYLFESLKELTNVLTDEDALSLLIIDKELSINACYKDMSFETKRLYLAKISSISESINASELLITKRLVYFSYYNDLDPMIVLFEHTKAFVKYVKNLKFLKKVAEKNGDTKELCYIFSVVALTLAITLGAYFLFTNWILAILMVIPTLIISECIINNLLSALVSPRPLPEMNFADIPSEHSTLIVVSEFITSAKQMKSAIEHLRVVRESNLDKNITASLLIDLRVHDREHADTDQEIIDMAKSIENEDGYCVFIRKRVKINKRYQAHERKRGAIMALTRYLMSGDSQEFLYISHKSMIKPTYLLALDADNVLSVGGAKELINIIAHPANHRYDLISARSRYNLFSLQTPYSYRFIRESALSNYPNYSSLYYNLFGKDIFCGKGIFRLKSFHNKLEGIFPDNKILSHDIIEGAVLNSASGSVVYEDAPKNFISDRERLKRWARGDIQLLPFIGKRWKKNDGERYPSRVSPIYKFLIIRNFINILFPIFTLGVGILSLFFSGIFYALATLVFLPLIIDILNTIRQGISARHRLRYVCANILRATSNAIIEFGLLPYYALCNIKLLFTTVFRMMFKGNLLEWKTYYHSQSASGKFANEVALSMLIMPILIAVTAVFRFFYIPAIIYAIFSYLVYLGVYLMGIERKKKEPEHTKLMDYAQKTYAYFRYMYKKGVLIADNLQVKPYKGMSKTTSPTNIAFQIISEISAYYLKLAERVDTLDILSDIIDLVEKLEKWQGNLYNWYRVADNSIAVPFVSSVDSGNFVASLIILHEFLLEENELSMAKRVDYLIKNTDLDSMFDGAKKQFHLGYNTKKQQFEGHYDLLASESRLLSIIYIAYSGNAPHWKALIRDFTPLYGNTLFSWSGTMFEYLLPEMFIKAPNRSMLDCSVKNAVRIQTKNKVRGVFGLSESGYYAFDDGLRYQYKAFGIDEIALGREKQKNVVSPYSTFLALEYSPKHCLENLAKLEGIGAYTDYGFYEAIDMEGQARLLSSYMTHHQGMIMMALTNYITDNKLRKLIQKNPKIAGAKILLSEAQENRSYRQKIESKRDKMVKNDMEYSISIANVEYSTASAGLTDGTLSLYCDALGGGFTLWNGTIVNRFTKGGREPSGRHFYIIDEDGKVASPTYITLQDDIKKYSLYYTPVSITYLNNEDDIKLDIALDGNLYAEINKITTTKGENKRIAFYEPLGLNNYASQNAHPVFNNMFIHTEYIDKHQAIIAKRQLKSGETPIYVALVVRGVTDIVADSNRFNVIGRGGSEKNPRFLHKDTAEKLRFGEVLEPCLAFTGKLISDSCEIIKIVSDSYDDILQKIAHIPDDYYGFATEMGGAAALNKLTSSLLYPLISMSYSNKTLQDIDKKGVRDDFINYTRASKLITFNIDCDTDLPSFKIFLRTIAELRYFALSPTIAVVLDSEINKDIERIIKEMLHEYCINNYQIYKTDTLPSELMESAFLHLDKSLIIPERTFYLVDKVSDTIKGKTAKKYDYFIKSGNGGIVADGYLLPLMEYPRLPYSNVICGEKGGMIITENGGGVVYFGNSYENRVLRFNNDPVKDTPYEKIFVQCEDKIYRINGEIGITDDVLIGLGFNRHVSTFNDNQTTLESYIISNGAIKVNELAIKGDNPIKILYCFDSMLGAEINSPFIYSQKVSDNMVKIKNLLTYQEVFIKIVGENIGAISFATVNGAISAETAVPLKGFSRLYVLIGLYDDIKDIEYADIHDKKVQSLMYFSQLNNVKISTNNGALDEIFNNWLMYQTVSSRLNGRCGYYQIGGATGFRDQLQDTLALLQRNPQRVRAQIIYHAERQYKEGDVMHWWHHPQMGLRTKISDDKLFLPFLTAEYIKVTRDFDVLNEKLYYLDSPVLGEHEHTRYESPPFAKDKGSLHEHNLRAIESALQYGEHNLLLLGTGDWNDGMDHIGSKGKGESVVLTMFCYEVINNYLEYCDTETQEKLKQVANKLKHAVETFAYDGKQYMRLYGDDDKWYGSYRSETLTIDLVSQSFSVISGIADKDRALSALNQGATLVDSDVGIIKLLAPPLDKNNYLGYISAYPKGVRENGGQYTHGAIWYIIALIRVGQVDKAYELFNMINPLAKCQDRQKNSIYMGEPYVISADVYSTQNAGRMGWSWYTGSSAWAYRLILEEFFGVRLRGNRLYITPSLPRVLDYATMEYKWGQPSMQSSIKIKFVKKGSYKLIVEGLAIHNKQYIELLENIKEVTVEY